MSNIFDRCGLRKVLDQEATEMIEDFKNRSSSGSSQLKLEPYQIFLSKSFLELLLNQMNESERNCVRLRLGNKKFPGGTEDWPAGEDRLSWMIQTVHAEPADAMEVTITNEGYWYSSESSENKSTEPPGVKTPPSGK